MHNKVSNGKGTALTNKILIRIEKEFRLLYKYDITKDETYQKELDLWES